MQQYNNMWQELNINIIGVNTLNVAFEQESTVNYKHNHVEYVATPDQESELKNRLQAAGVAVDVKPYTRIHKIMQCHALTDGAREVLHFQPGNYEMEGEYRFFLIIPPACTRGKAVCCHYCY